MGSPLWRHYDERALNEQLNLRIRTPEHPEIFERWEADSRAVRARLAHRFDTAYGEMPGEKLDFFPARDKQAPLLVFIHGGYWQGLDKAHYSYFAPAFVDQGIAFASLNYSLAPQARIGTMVEQVRRALAWLYERAEELGFDRERVVVSGHSAGGHLAAMAVVTDWAALALPPDWIAGCCSLSGVYQLEPIRHSYHQPILKLTQDEVADLSPQLLRPRAQTPTLLAVGALEPEEFREQQRELAEAWGLDNTVVAIEVPERHHFNVVDALIEEDQPLHRALLALLRDRRLP
ncbi:MAG TPA: alpha/beta hydrolase [Kiloniellales bacterium]|nr:alpha/beta hydrolase [Kiloniellales bacterium]